MLENVVPVDQAPGAVGQRSFAFEELAQVKTVRIFWAHLRDGLLAHCRCNFDPGDGKTGAGDDLQERSRAVPDLEEAGRLPALPLPPQEIEDELPVARVHAHVQRPIHAPLNARENARRRIIGLARHSASRRRTLRRRQDLPGEFPLLLPLQGQQLVPPQSVQAHLEPSARTTRVSAGCWMAHKSAPSPSTSPMSIDSVIWRMQHVSLGAIDATIAGSTGTYVITPIVNLELPFGRRPDAFNSGECRGHPQSSTPHRPRAVRIVTRRVRRTLENTARYGFSSAGTSRSDVRCRTAAHSASSSDSEGAAESVASVFRSAAALAWSPCRA